MLTNADKQKLKFSSLVEIKQKYGFTVGDLLKSKRTIFSVIDENGFTNKEAQKDSDISIPENSVTFFSGLVVDEKRYVWLKLVANNKIYYYNFNNNSILMNDVILEDFEVIQNSNEKLLKSTDQAKET